MLTTHPTPLLERYLPLKSLQGGMGVVHLCADLVERRPVALKTFRPELLADARAREQFIAEASVWMSIGSHPHVVTAHMVRRDADRVYVVCDFVASPEGISGAALRGWLGAPLGPELALELALGIVRGMSWACSRVPGLVHRDLKPENVLVGRDRRARVTDFGLALVRHGEQAGACGTPAYMAPEQWSGFADQRSDIYAFGLILLEMFTGWTGIAGSSFADLCLAHRSAAARQHAARSSLPDAVRPLLEGSLAVDPAQRPASWAVVEDALARSWPHLSRRPLPLVPEPATASREQRVLEGWSHNALANALSDLGQLRDAQAGYRAVLEMARQLGDEALQAAALGNLGQALVASADLDAALPALEESLALKRRLGDRLGEAGSTNTRGLARARMNRPAEALADFERAASLFAELGRERERAVVLANVVPLLAGLGRTDEALAVARTCRETFRALGDRRGEGAALGSMGQILRKQGALQQALEHSEQALACFRGAADRLGEARELSFQGHTLRAMKKMVEAIDRFRESGKLAEELGDKLLVGSAHYALAQMTPPVESFKALGHQNARIAVQAYRDAGRDDLAADAEALLRVFE